MIDVLYFILVAFISYFIGTINFSKILSWRVKHRDITKMGSGNPGTMNMLRSYGFGIALATFIAEVVKSGLTCLVFKLIFPQYDQVIYFVSALSLLLGNDFPAWSKFKGGKGVATFAGVFLFSNLWYVALAWFVICFILFLFIEYASVISFTYTGGLSIAYTIYAFVCQIYYAWLVVAIIWLMYVITLARHHANIKRLFTHTENKIDFKAKLVKVFKHKKGETIIDEEYVEHAPEAEIIVTELEKKEETDKTNDDLQAEELHESDVNFSQNTSIDDENNFKQSDNKIEEDKDIDVQYNDDDEKIDLEDLDLNSLNDEITNNLDGQSKDDDIKQQVTDDDNCETSENINSNIEEIERKQDCLTKKGDEGDD